MNVSRTSTRLAAVVLATGLLTLAVLVIRSGGAVRAAPADDAPSAPAPAPKPSSPRVSEPRPEEDDADVVILLSGREYGLLKPCGCTAPQMGGLERRAVLFATAKAHAKAAAALSIGDTLRVGSNAGDRRQDGLKAELFRAALETMGYAGQLLGPADLEALVESLLTPYGAGAGAPRPPLNVMIKPGGPLASLARVDPTLRFTLTGPWGTLPVRAVSVVDQTSMRSALAPYAAAEAVNPPQAGLAALAKEPGLLIVAAHTMREDLAEIVGAATAKADYAVVVDVGGEVAMRTPVREKTFARGLLVTFDELGKEVGLLRLRRTKTGFTASYDPVALGPVPYEAPAHPAYAALTALFDVYRRRVKEERLLEGFDSFSDAPDQPRWTGSAACASCHPGIADDWKNTAHAHAMATLVERGYADDPECVRCHTVGWMASDRGGWTRRASSFQTREQTPGLVDVGCEACHGPGSRHVADPSARDAFGKDGEPWSEDRMWRRPGVDRCRACHDVENSHGFNVPNGAETYVAAVDHRGVKEGRTVRGGEKGAAGADTPRPPAPPTSPPGPPAGPAGPPVPTPVPGTAK